MRHVSILGSTGSIGASTIDVIVRHPDRLRAVALAARSRWQAMLEQVRLLKPSVAALLDPDAASELERAVRAEGLPTRVLAGAGGVDEAAACAEADTVVAAIVGAAGLGPSLAAARAGKRILLANKEALVMAGPLFMEAVRAGGATLLPIDSEHNAIFQALPAGFSGNLAQAGVRRLLLTASGGPFRTATAASLESVTPDQACAHPNWVMGRKISVDSATLMNKGLEVIEARWLFGAAPGQIQVVIHPQSVVHSLVEYVDGSVLAQLGNPDMRTPIAHALAYPERVSAGVEPLDLFRVGRLDFEPPDPGRFPCLRLAYEALEAGGAAPAILNAANEAAVAAFLDRRISFPGIARVISGVLERCDAGPVSSMEAVLAADGAAREAAAGLIARL